MTPVTVHREDNGDIKAGSWIQLIISIITPSEKLPDHSPVRLKSPQTAPYFWPSLKMKKKQRQTMCMPHLWKGHKKQIQPHAASVQNINGSGFVLTHWITVRIEQQVGVEITQLSTFPVPLKKKSSPIIVANAITSNEIGIIHKMPQVNGNQGTCKYDASVHFPVRWESYRDLIKHSW